MFISYIYSVWWFLQNSLYLSKGEKDLENSRTSKQCKIEYISDQYYYAAVGRYIDAFRSPRDADQLRARVSTWGSTCILRTRVFIVLQGYEREKNTNQFIELNLKLNQILYFVTNNKNRKEKKEKKKSTPVRTKKVWLYAAQWLPITCTFASTSTSGWQSIFFPRGE